MNGEESTTGGWSGLMQFQANRTIEVTRSDDIERAARKAGRTMG
jgi:hypothetical protein